MTDRSNTPKTAAQRALSAHSAILGLICDDIAEGGDGSRVFNAARDELARK